MLKIIMLTCYLAVGAVEDIRHRSVPFVWIVFGGAMTMLLLISTFMTGPSIIQTAKTSVLGVGVTLPLLAVSAIRPEHFGRADAAAVLMIGLLTGPIHTTIVIVMALLFASTIGVTMLVIRRKHAAGKSAMAFLPCLTAGLIGAQFL